jgi:uncharacterized protein (TIGR03435 family)
LAIRRSCLLALACGSSVWAQNQASAARGFEAASVKTHVASGALLERAGIEENMTLVKIENLPLRVLIGMAYTVKAFQVAGPGWLDTDTFDIMAKPQPGYQRDQLPGLLEKLLADRFNLAVHHEVKRAMAYALVVSKGGHKLQEATGPRTYFTVRKGLIEGKQRSIAELKNGLAGMLDRPVEDRTALTGSYDLKLEWNPEELAAGTNSQANEGPSLFSAIQEQLGLKLERTTMPVDFVVVDHAQRIPVAN